LCERHGATYDRPTLTYLKPLARISSGR
jgi:hypothetical protein